MGKTGSSLKEADAFQRLVSHRRYSELDLLDGPSKKQTPFSVWYARETYSPLAKPESPQRSRRLSASGIPDSAKAPSAAPHPQRSRRLSASGMRHPLVGFVKTYAPSKKQTPFSVWYPSFSLRAALPTSALKEADAFQRLVLICGQPRVRYTRNPQRSRRLSASGITPPPSNARESPSPSKKQTPFSVWYAAAG